jgi:hypothetical protein
MQDFCILSRDNQIHVLSTLSRLGIHTLNDLLLLQQQPATLWDNRLLRLRGVTLEHMDLTLAFVDQLSASSIIQENQPCNLAASWKWIDQDKNNSEFCITNAEAYDYLATNGMDTARWNATWSRTDLEETWKKWWSHLWCSDLSTRAKVFIWRILAKALFTGACAILMGHQDTNCKVCPSELETIPHLFERCCHARRS